MNTITRRETVVSVKLHHELLVLSVKRTFCSATRLLVRVRAWLTTLGSLEQAISVSLVLSTLILSKGAVHDSEVTKLVDLLVVVMLGGRCRCLNNIMDELLGLFNLVVGVCGNQKM